VPGSPFSHEDFENGTAPRFLPGMTIDLVVWGIIALVVLAQWLRS
jgi:hypothetical protein